ncbi:MAG: response regulator, partial [Clostridia bacterium]|nr:response regulator [Clostridia bacterium]
MIEIAICDDQAEFAMQFSDSINKICAEKFTDSEDVHICGIFSSAEQVLGALSQKRIDILFLDIELEGMSGFELAEIVHQNYPETILMFVSSYERLVYVSFRFSPFRFLRKAMLSEELKGALRDAIDLKMSKEKTVQLKTSD